MTQFDSFLLSKGWKRYRCEWKGKKQIEIEDWESSFISTYGPLEYRYRHEKYPFAIYWGLYLKGHHPKYFVIRHGDERDYFEPTQEQYLKLISSYET